LHHPAQVAAASRYDELRAISLVNEGVELYPEIGERLPADLRQRAATHEETLLQARVESLPQRNQPNPDIAARNGLQVEVQDLVDQVLAGVATHCWRNPEILAELKAALPATRPPRLT